MSRKHYIEVARVIRQQVEKAEAANTSAVHVSEVTTALTEVAESLADMFKRDNSAFDRSRFMEACGLTSEGN